MCFPTQSCLTAESTQCMKPISGSCLQSLVFFKSHLFPIVSYQSLPLRSVNDATKKPLSFHRAQSWVLRLVRSTERHRSHPHIVDVTVVLIPKMEAYVPMMQRQFLLSLNWVVSAQETPLNDLKWFHDLLLCHANSMRLFLYWGTIAEFLTFSCGMGFTHCPLDNHHVYSIHLHYIHSFSSALPFQWRLWQSDLIY